MKPELFVCLESERALLRPLTIEDEAELQHIANDESLWIYGLSDLSKPEELKKYIQKAIADRDNDTCSVWVIIDKKTNSIAGCTRLADISWKDERNHQSRQALIGIGTTREGVLREHMKLHNGYIRNTVIYSILKSEWDTIKTHYFTNFISLL